MSFNNFVNTLRNYDLSYFEIEINTEFCYSKCGIFRFLQVTLGFVCFMSVVVSCLNYDPYYQSYSGFIGGKSETAFLLIVFTCLMWSTLLMLCYVFSTHMSSVIPKTTLELFHISLSFVSILIISFVLLFEVSIRNSNNSNKVNDKNEPGFAGKIIASVFGIINSVVYAVSITYYYKLYKTILNVV